MSKDNLIEIVTQHDKGIKGSKNILARLYRKILYDLDTDYGQLDRAIEDYLKRQQMLVPRAGKDQRREKGNIVKELSNDSLTIKNFIKGIMVLNPKSMKLTVEIKWRRGEVTTHSAEMDLDDGLKLEDEEQ